MVKAKIAETRFDFSPSLTYNLQNRQNQGLECGNKVEKDFMEQQQHGFSDSTPKA